MSGLKRVRGWCDTRGEGGYSAPKMRVKRKYAPKPTPSELYIMIQGGHRARVFHRTRPATARPRNAETTTIKVLFMLSPAAHRRTPGPTAGPNPPSRESPQKDSMAPRPARGNRDPTPGRLESGHARPSPRGWFSQKAR